MTRLSQHQNCEEKKTLNVNEYMPIVTNLTGHASLLRSMYRELLRSLMKISRLNPVIATNAPDELVRKELDKASKNPKLYGVLLTSELRYYIDECFKIKHKRFNSKSLFSSLQTGLSLSVTLKNLRGEPQNPTYWAELIKMLVNHRTSQHSKQLWKQEYMDHAAEINRGRSREVDPLTLKQIQSRASKPRHESRPDFSELSSGEQYKEYKRAKLESKNNSQFVVRQYLKHLQLNCRIPNPYKLPYVSETLTRRLIDLPKLTILLPGSTKTFVMNQAYDMEYIDAIIKPELESIINDKHILDPLEKAVIKDGPYKVKIRNTTAGVMTANFLRAPNYRSPMMKKLALDIKKLMRRVRKQFIWNLDSRRKVNASEKLHGDGYAVRGSRGHSSEEIMYPRQYYERMADEESFWEALMNVEAIKLVHGDKVVLSREVQQQLRAADQSNFGAWRVPLEEASRTIDSEIQALYDEYKVTKNSPIWYEQTCLQEKMNQVHQRKVESYSALIQKLEDDFVFLHSDLFMNQVSSDSHEVSMKRDSFKRDDRAKGISEYERRSQGKRLADYLEDSGIQAFRMGNRFTKKIKF